MCVCGFVHAHAGRQRVSGTAYATTRVWRTPHPAPRPDLLQEALDAAVAFENDVRVGENVPQRLGREKRLGRLHGQRRVKHGQDDVQAVQLNGGGRHMEGGKG